MKKKLIEKISKDVLIMSLIKKPNKSEIIELWSSYQKNKFTINKIYLP